MIYDLICPNNQITFNIKIAEKIGLNPAIYLSELMNLQEKEESSKKQKVIDGFTYFKLNKSYLTTRTTFALNEQSRLIDGLTDLNLITSYKEGNSSYICINYEAVIALVEESLDKQQIKELKRSFSTKSSWAEIDRRRMELRLNIYTENEELKQAYYNWIDSALNRYGKMFNYSAVIQAQKDVDAFAQHNLDIALALVNDASKSGYNTFEYVIERYKKANPTYNPMRGHEVSREVVVITDKGVGF